MASDGMATKRLQPRFVCMTIWVCCPVVLPPYGSLPIEPISVGMARNVVKGVELIAQEILMKDQGHAVSLICGTQTGWGEEKMDPAMRDHVMKEFRDGVTKVLIATDVISRGIDVTLVVNYELPISFNDQWRGVNMETYLHRVGRTGRFGLKGIAVNLVTPNELHRVQEICDYYSCNITEFTKSFDDLEETLRKLR
eukprot:symbB.v1.2.021014.t1/scaffold1777.1/size101761/9